MLNGNSGLPDFSAFGQPPAQLNPGVPALNFQVGQMTGHDSTTGRPVDLAVFNVVTPAGQFCFHFPAANLAEIIPALQKVKSGLL